MKLPRLGRQVASVRGGAAVNPAAGLPESTLADVLGAFSNQQAKVAAQGAVDQAALEGFNEATESGELPEASNITAAGRAFNTAARGAHLAGIKRDVKLRLGELAIQANALPAEQRVDAFIDTSDGFREGLLAEVDADFRGATFDYFSEEAGGLRLKILAGQQADLQSQVVADLALGQQQLLDDIDSAAREFNEPLLTKRQREYEGLIGQGVEAGFISEAAGAVAIQDMHSLAVMSETLGAFDSVLDSGDLEAAAKSLSRFKREKASRMGFSAAEKDAIETTMQGLFNREKSVQAQGAARETAAEKAARARLIQNADNTIAQLKAGFPVDVEDLANDLIAGEEPSKFVDLQEAVRLQGQLAPLLAAPPGAQTAVLQDLQDQARAGKLDPANFPLLKALESTERTTQTLLDSDPRTLARQQGQLPDDQDLDFSGSGALAASIKARQAGSQSASEHYGFDIPVLYDNEVDQFGRFWASSDIDGKLALSEEIASGLGPDAEQIFSKLDKKDFRTAAFTGQLVADGESGLARSILRGKEIMNADIMPEGPTEKGVFDAHINESLGSALAHIPRFRQTVVDSIAAVYADRSSLERDFTRETDVDRINQAISAVIGNIVEDPTGSEVAFKGGDQRAFDSWIFGLDGTDIAAAGGVQGFEDDAGADLVKRSHFAAMGPGEFWITTPNPFTGMPGFLMQENGEPFRLVFTTAGVDKGQAAGVTDNDLILQARGE